jgi:DamX protein
MRTEPSFSEEPEIPLLDGPVAMLASEFDSVAQDKSEYRHGFGLSMDPFVDDPHYPFYTGAQRRELLEQLLHLCRFSQNVLLVTGQYGVGKTRMAQALIDGLDDSDDICFVDARDKSDIDSFIAEVLLQFELTSRGEFTEFCAKKSVQDGLVVVIIDNAHHLHTRVVEDLIHLMYENVGSRLHLVLFSEPQLIEILHNINHSPVTVTEFYLEKFSLTEAVDYLNFRMEMADYLGPDVFVESKVEPWWRQSQGQLLLLHDFALEKLSTPVAAPRSRFVPKQSLPLPHLIIAAMLLGGLFFGYLYFGGARSNTSSSEILPADKKTASQLLSATSVSDVSIPTSTDSSFAAVNANTKEEVSSSVQASSTQKLNDTIVDQAKSVPSLKQSIVPLVQVNTPHSQRSHDNAHFSSASAVSENKKIEASIESAKLKLKIENTTADLTKSTSGFSDQEKMLLAWDGTDYTLQIVGLSSEKAAHEFISLQPNKKDLVLFKSRRQGKDWFVVVTGRFPTAAKARVNVQGLPEPQRKAMPWPREIKVIQSEIRQR